MCELYFYNYTMLHPLRWSLELHVGYVQLRSSLLMGTTWRNRCIEAQRYMQ